MESTPSLLIHWSWGITFTFVTIGRISNARSKVKGCLLSLGRDWALLCSWGEAGKFSKSTAMAMLICKSPPQAPMLLQSPACQCLPDFATKICYGVGSVLDTRAITAATVTNSATNCKIVKQFKWICAVQIVHHKLPSRRHPSCSGFTKKTWIWNGILLQ